MLAIGGRALGFWKAIREVFPDIREQRCWLNEGGNVFAALPKSAHLGAKAALAEIHNAENKQHASTAAKALADLHGAKWSKAVATVTEHLDMLLAFYDYPAEHWVHLRTTNPIEPTFATARPRVTKDPASGPPGWRWRSSSSSPPSAVCVP